jgi:hypothetical protein
MTSHPGPVARALADIPLDQIKAVMEIHPEVKLIIKRSNTAKGTWASLPSFTMATAEVGMIEDWFRENHGGGRYRVSCRNPQNELEEVITPFYVEIAGAPKPLESTRTRAPFGPPQMHPSQYMPRPGMPWGAVPYVRDQGKDDKDGLDPSMFMSQTPDAIAMEQVRELRQELREMRTVREREQREHEQRLEQERVERAKIEKEQQKVQHQHEKEMMELRMQLIGEKSAPKGSQIDWVPLVVGLVPVFKALVDSGKERQALTLNAQQESAKLQTQGLQTMIATLDKGKNKDDGLKDLLTLGMPLILKMMDEKSPGAVTKLISAMADNQLQTISMVSQLMQQMSPDNENPWMDVARKAIEGVQSVAEQMVEVQQVKQTNGNGGGRGRGRPAITPGRSAEAPLSEHSPPKAFADALFAAPNLPKELRTSEWYDLFAMLHDVSADPKETALAVSAHLEALADANQLPSVFAGVLDDDGRPPSATLRPFLQQLPLAQLSPARLEQICKAFDNVLTVDGDSGEDRDGGGDGPTPAAFAVGPTVVSQA